MKNLKQKIETHLVSRGLKFSTNPPLKKNVVNAMADFINQEFTEKDEECEICLLHPTGLIEKRETTKESMSQDIINVTLNNLDSAIIIDEKVMYTGTITKEEIELYYNRNKEKEV